MSKLAAAPVLFVSTAGDGLDAVAEALSGMVHGLEGLVVLTPHWEAARPLVGGGDDGLVVTLLDQRGLLPAAAQPPDAAAARLAEHLKGASGLPVVHVSIVPLQSPRYHHLIGRALRPLAERGIALLALGALGRASRPAPTAHAFTGWIEARLAAGDVTALLDYRRHAPDVWANQPTGMDLLPFFVALGATRPGQPWRRLVLDSAKGPAETLAFASGLASSTAAQ